MWHLSVLINKYVNFFTFWYYKNQQIPIACKPNEFVSLLVKLQANLGEIESARHRKHRYLFRTTLLLYLKIYVLSSFRYLASIVVVLYLEGWRIRRTKMAGWSVRLFLCTMAIFIGWKTGQTAKPTGKLKYFI